MGTELNVPSPDDVSLELGLGDVIWIEMRLRLGLPMHKVVMVAASVVSESPSAGQRRARFGGITMNPAPDDGLRQRLHSALDAACDRMGI